MLIRRWKMLTAIGALLILTALVIGCSTAVAEPSADVPVETEAALLHDDDEAGHDEAVGMISEEAYVDDHDAHDDDHDLDDADMIEVALGVIEGRNWGFDPPVIEVRAGTPVMLTLVNDGRVEHDVEIARLMADDVEKMGGAEHNEAAGHHDMDVVAVHAMPGTTAAVMFTPMEAGEYEYVCTLPGHKEAGMIGTLIVTN